MKNIITIQHTQSVHHTNGMVGSWTDWPLTEKGLAQAKTIGENLRRELAGRSVVLYTSDLTRAAQTAQTIGESLGVRPIARSELRERNLGSACGQSVEWMHAHQTCFETTVDDRLFPDAESRRDEWNRLKPFFEELMAGPEQEILIVAHGDLLSVFNAMFMGLPPESLDSCEVFGLAGGVSQMQQDDRGRRRIKRISDLSYLK